MNKITSFFILLVIIAAGAGVWWLESNAQTQPGRVSARDMGNGISIELRVTDIPADITDLVAYASPVERLIGAEVGRMALEGQTEAIFAVAPILPRNRNYYTVLGIAANGKSTTLGTAYATATSQATTVMVASQNTAGEPYVTSVNVSEGLPGETLIPFEERYAPGSARADLTGDGRLETLVYQREGGSTIRIFRDDETLMGEVQAYDEAFTHGVIVQPLSLYAHESFERFFAVAPRWASAPEQGPARPVKIYRYDATAATPFVVHDEFIAFERFDGGVSLAAGDVTGDGRDELLTMPIGGLAEIRIHHFCDDLTTACEQYYGPQRMTQPWSVYDKIFPYGKLAVADLGVIVGDINNDGIQEIVTYPKAGYKALARVYVCDIQEEYRCLARQTRSEQMYHDSFTGGVNMSLVSGTDPLLIVAPRVGGGPHVKAYRVTDDFEQVYELFVYDARFAGGVALTTGMTTEGQRYFATAPMTKGGPQLRIFDAQTGSFMMDRFVFDTWQRSPIELE